MVEKKILILWLWAFGFAVAKYLGERHPQQRIFAYERNLEIVASLQKHRKHPYFFSDTENNLLPHNINIVESHALKDILPAVDILICIIPCEALPWSIADITPFLKAGICIVNLAKGIDSESFETMGEQLSHILWWQEYSYACLAGGMIASELVSGRPLWADIVTQNKEVWIYLADLFASKTLDINLKIWSPKSTELSAALKNIVALILWYYEGQWYGASSLAYYFRKMIQEVEGVIALLGGDTPIDFSDYAFSADLIATCFWESRNRQLGLMLGSWMNISEALEVLAREKKIAEGYKTLKWVYKIVQGKSWFDEIQKMWEKIFDK